jgi:threonine/homoserine/homoserine lactone efflux protein
LAEPQGVSGILPDSSLYGVAAILLALLIGAASPGPSFVLVSRIAVSESRRHGLAAAAGMGLGGTLFGALALAGLVALLQQVEWLYAALKLVGGSYLLYLGFVVWNHAAEPLVVVEARAASRSSVVRAFLVAFIVQVSNPKTAVVYASIFAALLPASLSVWLLLALPPLIFVIETTWYGVVALVLSSSRPRAVYLSGKVLLDRIAGGLLAGLGVSLVIEGIRSRA